MYLIREQPCLNYYSCGLLPVRTKFYLMTHSLRLICGSINSRKTLLLCVMPFRKTFQLICVFFSHGNHDKDDEANKARDKSVPKIIAKRKASFHSDKFQNIGYSHTTQNNEFLLNSNIQGDQWPFCTVENFCLDSSLMPMLL